MDVRRGVAAGIVGLALLAGSTGCSKVGEKVAEEAVERAGDCQDVDIDSGGSVSGTCDGQSFDADVNGDAQLPADFPAEIAPPEGYSIITATASDTPVRSLNVVGGIDGDVTEIYDGIKTQLTEAGYTIDTDSLADAGGGMGPTGNLMASGPEWTVTVNVVQDPSGQLEGNVSLTYSLNAAG